MDFNEKEERVKMALITCPECGKEISDKAKACPFCGYPIEAEEKTTETSIEQQINLNVEVDSGYEYAKMKHNLLAAIVTLVGIFGVVTIIAYYFYKNWGDAIEMGATALAMLYIPFRLKQLLQGSVIIYAIINWAVFFVLALVFKIGDALIVVYLAIPILEIIYTVIKLFILKNKVKANALEGGQQ